VRPGSGRPPRRRPGGRGDAAPILAGAGIVVVVLVVVGLIGGALMLQRSQAKIDQVTLCPTTGPSAVTAVLVDATDVISPVQRAAVAAAMQTVISRLRLNEEVAVYAIDPSRDPLKPPVVVCRPVRPDEVSELTGNKALAERRFRQIFEGRVSTLMNQAIAGPTQDLSPIMEDIQAIAVSYFHAADAAARGGKPLPKRLVIVSDMLENAAGGSHYRGVPDFAAYKTSPAYAAVRSDLSGVEVTIFYLRRDNAAGVQGRTHVKFWEDWFADQGGSLVDVRRMEG
jgi:hypothetical protein